MTRTFLIHIDKAAASEAIVKHHLNKMQDGLGDICRIFAVGYDDVTVQLPYSDDGLLYKAVDYLNWALPAASPEWRETYCTGPGAAQARLYDGDIDELDPLDTVYPVRPEGFKGFELPKCYVEVRHSVMGRQWHRVCGPKAQGVSGALSYCKCYVRENAEKPANRSLDWRIVDEHGQVHQTWIA